MPAKSCPPLPLPPLQPLRPPSPHTPSPPPLLQAIMSSKFWADACATAHYRPLQTLIDTAYASCGVTVSWGCRC